MVTVSVIAYNVVSRDVQRDIFNAMRASARRTRGRVSPSIITAWQINNGQAGMLLGRTGRLLRNTAARKAAGDMSRSSAATTWFEICGGRDESGKFT